MTDFRFKLNTELVGTQMECVHCGETMEEGDCYGDNVTLVDLTEGHEYETMVFKDIECPSCGSNTFENVFAFLNVSLV